MMNTMPEAINLHSPYLGIELGSTRIKAVLIGSNYRPIASGAHDWENRLERGVWTYSLDDVWAGLRDAYARLAANVRDTYGVELTTVGAMGVSGMMHGYLPFDAAGEQLAPFRTWRNTMTGEAAAALTAALGFNIPQRWSVAHLYQAILSGETHVRDIVYLTTLAGYVHWKLTGCRVAGVGEASGMFPIDPATGDYDAGKLAAFGALVADRGYPWTLRDILPAVLPAGGNAGTLTAEGAALLDPTGALRPGAYMCPPEGDAGTGMVATNSVAPRTGNVSAGTSIFAMLVLEKGLSAVHNEIDMVTTPAGRPVAMVHGNNCTSDLDAWVGLFRQAMEAVGAASGFAVSKPALYDALYEAAMAGDADAGGLLSYNFLSGEDMLGILSGRPLFVRPPDSKLTLPNFMRSLLYGTMATLRHGMDILAREGVRVESLTGHGGLFKTPRVGQTLMAGALNVPVTVLESAGEGGAWGIALLAAYRANKREGEPLENFLANRVFADMSGSCVEPDAAIAAGFDAYMERYRRGLAVERAAVEFV